MSEAELYELRELPPDELDGKSGDKRKFMLSFIAKAPNEKFPYTVANETIGSFLASVLGFQVPIVIPHTIEGIDQALVLWMNAAARKQVGPQLTSKAILEYLDLHKREVHGAIILDLFLANSDRAFGPTRRNIAVDETGNLILFDFGNALYYRNREHVGIVAGIPRLKAVEANLSAMFDKKEPDIGTYYFQLLTDLEEVAFWCDRIRALPRFVLENAVTRIPRRIDPPTNDERIELVEFLERRKNSLFEDIRNSQNLFPNLVVG